MSNVLILSEGINPVMVESPEVARAALRDYGKSLRKRARSIKMRGRVRQHRSSMRKHREEFHRWTQPLAKRLIWWDVYQMVTIPRST